MVFVWPRLYSQELWPFCTKEKWWGSCQPIRTMVVGGPFWHTWIVEELQIQCIEDMPRPRQCAAGPILSSQKDPCCPLQCCRSKAKAKVWGQLVPCLKQFKGQVSSDWIHRRQNWVNTGWYRSKTHTVTMYASKLSVTVLNVQCQLWGVWMVSGPFDIVERYRSFWLDTWKTKLAQYRVIRVWNTSCHLKGSTAVGCCPRHQDSKWMHVEWLQVHLAWL